MKTISLVVLLSALSLSFLTHQSQAHELTTAPESVVVTGVGELDMEPDMAILSITISAQKPNLAEAKKSADDKYRRALAEIKKVGIDKRDIKATQIRAQPQYQWRDSRQVYKGELVSRTLSITINDLDNLSSLMQGLVDSDVSKINSVQAGFKNKEQLFLQALAIAADDAKSKAQFLAQRLDRNLGKAYDIREQNATSVIRPQHFASTKSFASEALASQPPEESLGTQKISARVNVSFYLL